MKNALIDNEICPNIGNLLLTKKVSDITALFNSPVEFFDSPRSVFDFLEFFESHK